MNSKNNKQPFHVEKLLNEVVVSYGGNLVVDFVSRHIDTPNADYVFYEQNVIAELKCFQKDPFNSIEDSDRVKFLLDKWRKAGYFDNEEEVKQMLIKRKLPKECFNDLVKLSRKTIDRAIHHANKQIVETKKLLNLPNAKGLLLVANDGNYFFNHIQFMDQIVSLMTTKYSSYDIESVIYFTVNVDSVSPNSERGNSIWLPLHKDDSDENFMQFCYDLGEQLRKHLTSLTGIPFYIASTPDHEGTIKKIAQLKYLPKNQR